MSEDTPSFVFTLVATPEDIASLNFGRLRDCPIHPHTLFDSFQPVTWAWARIRMDSEDLSRLVWETEIQSSQKPEDMVAAIQGADVIATNYRIANRWIEPASRLYGDGQIGYRNLLQLEALANMCGEDACDDVYSLGKDGISCLEPNGNAYLNLPGFTVSWMAEIFSFCFGVFWHTIDFARQFNGPIAHDQGMPRFPEGLSEEDLDNFRDALLRQCRTVGAPTLAPDASGIIHLNNPEASLVSLEAFRRHRDRNDPTTH